MDHISENTTTHRCDYINDHFPGRILKQRFSFRPYAYIHFQFLVSPETAARIYGIRVTLSTNACHYLLILEGYWALDQVGSVSSHQFLCPKSY